MGVEGSLPVKAQKKPRRVEEWTVFLLVCGGRAALRLRDGKGLLAGLWELPGVQGRLTEEEARGVLLEWGAKPCPLERLESARHVFTHLEWRMTGWAGEVDAPCPGFFWASKEDLRRDITLPSAFKAYRAELFRLLGETP